MILDGGCLCGALRLRITAAPTQAGLCHCLTCRKETGATFKLFADFPADAVTITGATAYWTAKDGARRHFCPACGSHVFETTDADNEIEINVGALDEPNRIAPGYEIWVVRREHWLPRLGLPTFPGDRDD